MLTNRFLDFELGRLIQLKEFIGLKIEKNYFLTLSQVYLLFCEQKIKVSLMNKSAFGVRDLESTEKKSIF